jgi:NhaA family Na+:H+ antiporter
VLCGVGFTMSLFIGSLAFVGADSALTIQVKVGVIMGSLLSASLAVLLLLSQSEAASD